MSEPRPTWRIRAVADRDVDEISECIAIDDIDAAIRSVNKVRRRSSCFLAFRGPDSCDARQALNWGRFAQGLFRVAHGAQDVDRLIDELD